MKKITLLLFLFATLPNLMAQKAVEIDLTKDISNNISDLPFDRPVLLRLKSPGQFIGDIKIIELRGKQRRVFKDSLPNLENNRKRDDFLKYWLSKNKYYSYPTIPKSNFAYNYYGFTEKEDEKKDELFVRLEAIRTSKLNDDFFIPNPYEEEKESKTKKTSSPKIPVPQEKYRINNSNVAQKEQEVNVYKKIDSSQAKLNEIKIKTEITPFYLKPKSNYLLIINTDKKVKIKDDAIRGQLYSAAVSQLLEEEKKLGEIEATVGENDKKNILSTYNYFVYEKNESLVNSTVIPEDKLTLEQTKGLNYIYNTFSYRNEYGKLNRFFKDSIIFISYGKLINSEMSFKNIIRGVDNFFDWEINNNTAIVIKNKAINLKKSLKVLEKHKIVVDYFTASVDQASLDYGNLKQYKVIIDSLYNKCSKNLKLINEMIELEAAITEIAVSRNIPEAVQETSLLGNSEIFNFETRSNFAVTPEFGYIFIPSLARGTITGNGAPDADIQKGYNTPFIGFHINFRYWDKNIPFNHHPNTKFGKWNQGARLSWMIGYTLAPMKSSFAEPIFGNGRNLITGVGFRLGNAVRIVSGVMLNSKINGTIDVTKTTGYNEIKKTVTDGQGISQTVTESVPFVKNTSTEKLTNKLGCSFFLGISLDLSLKFLAGDAISDLLPFRISNK